jgi:hypothetical protein
VSVHFDGSRAPRRWVLRVLLAAGLALSLPGCGSGGKRDSGEPEAGPLRVVEAMIKGFLSNKVDAKETKESAPEREPAPPQPDAASFAETAPPETCVVPYSGPVTIIPVRSAMALARSVAERPRQQLVYETENTAIFGDGRVITTDVEDVGRHLNAVGWSANPIQILGASVVPGGSSQNLGWSSGEGPKKRRVRG